MSELEEQSALETARDRGEKEGLKQGKEEGIKQTKKEIAKKLIKTKMPIEEIEKITGLTEAEIKEIKKEFNLQKIKINPIIRQKFNNWVYFLYNRKVINS